MILSGNTYLISYDLHRDRDYTRLYQLLASWDAVRLTESNWLACLAGPTPIIRDLVAGTLDNDYTVAVVQLPHGSDWATLRTNAAAVAMLSADVTPAEIAA